MIERETVVAEPLVEIVEREVLIKHKPENENAIYDICSMEGRILITGKFQGDDTKVDLDGYPTGGYNIFILDGEQVYKNSFRI